MVIEKISHGIKCVDIVKISQKIKREVKKNHIYDINDLRLVIE